MKNLIQAIPDPDVLLGLEPEELGAKLLFFMRANPDLASNGMFIVGSLTHDLWGDAYQQGPRYPNARQSEVRAALAEAWAWLEAQGLLVPAADTNGQNGWRVLSRRARKFENEAEFANYAAARHLARDALHPRIAGPAWMSFMRGEFDTAVFQAAKAVEVAVREAAGFGDSAIGVDLVRKAFDVDKGPLTDKSAERGGRQARSDLFAGAIGSFKNPQSHRDVSLDNPAEAAEIVMFASYLLRVVDAVKSFRRPV